MGHKVVIDQAHDNLAQNLFNLAQRGLMTVAVHKYNHVVHRPRGG